MAVDSSQPPRLLDVGSPSAFDGLFYSQERVWERIWQPSFLISAILLLVTIGYHSRQTFGSSSWRGARPFSDHIWSTIIYLIPSNFVFAIDHWLNRPLPPLACLQAPARTPAAKSDALRRILRLDRAGSIMESAWKVSRPRLMSFSITGSRISGRAYEPAGLGNRDNSCYQNSILQALASLQPLPQYLSDILDDPLGGSVSEQRTVDSLRELVNDLNDGSNNGKTLWTPRVLKSMSTWQQQDAQEYFSKLLDEIDQEVAKALRTRQRATGLESSPRIHETDGSTRSSDSGYHSLADSFSTAISVDGNPLEGLVAQRVACQDCGFSEGLSMIPFNCLTLNLGGELQYDLYERLDHYTHMESIQDVECPKCTLLNYQRLTNLIITRGRASGRSDGDLALAIERMQLITAALEEDRFDDRTLSETCKIPHSRRVSSTKSKQTVIARPSRSLVLHLNRSVFDETTGQMFKNFASVQFPTTLNIGPWCLGSAGFHQQQQVSHETTRDNDKNEERWPLDPTVSMIGGSMASSTVMGPIYHLRAVITHQGRHENGHYVCYRRYPTRSPPNLAPKNLNELELHDEFLGDDAGDVALETSGPRRSADEEEEGEEACLLEEKKWQWWRLSDHQVSLSSEDAVLAEGGVFMLFYDCVDSHVTRLDEPAYFETLDFMNGLASVPETCEEVASSPGSSAGRDGRVMRPSGAAEDYPLAQPTEAQLSTGLNEDLADS